MKKSLSLLLAITLVFSMFGSLAFAADELTVEQKYEALKAASIFSGMPDGSAGLDQKMTRAQFARVAGLLAGLDVDAEPSTQTFSDVPPGHWAYEEVEAAAAAGLVEGMGDGTFNPSGNVTIQQLAVVAAKILKLEPVEGAKVEGAADWAAPYIQALLDAGIQLPTNYTDEALRADLVNASYEVAVKIGVIAPDQVSVVSAKPIGVQKVEVQLNKAVDPSKAKFTLKRGTATLETDAKFSDDNKTVVLELTTSRITAGDYSVTLSGLEESEIANATATFKAEDETVKSIEFVNASDTIAYSKFVTLKLLALNQYGEPVAQGAGNFSAYVNGQAVTPTKDSEGNLVLRFDATGSNLIQGNSVIPVTVFHNDTRVSVQKNFKLGVVPLLSKVELGEVKYSNGGSALSSTDETATIKLYMYDQYGNPVVQQQMDNGEISEDLVNVLISPYSPNLTWDKSQLWDNDGNAQAVIKLTGKEDKSTDYNVTIYAGSDSKVTKVSVSAAKLATKIEFGTFSGTVAEGDTKTFYVPLIAYDANGNQLSAQEIVDNVKAGRITFSGSNTDGNPAVESYGEHKGQLAFKLNPGAKARSTVYLTALIATANANSYVQTNIPVQEARYPDRIIVKDEPAAKAILGASTKIKFQIKDQYGADLGNIPATVTTGSGQAYNYRVQLTLTGDADAAGITVTDADDNVILNGTTTAVVFDHNEFANFNKELKIKTTANKTGKVTLKAVIQRKADNSTNWVDYSSTISRSVEAIKSDADLTFELASLGTIYAMIDKQPNGIGSDDLDVSKSFFAKKLSVTAKDSAGSKVALPDNRIVSVVAENPAIVDVYAANADDATKFDGYVLGNAAGETTVTAVVYTNKGVNVTLTSKVTVSAEPIRVASLSADNEFATFTVGTTRDALELFGDLVAKDQYGVEYKNDKIVTYEKLLGIRFTVTSVDAGTVTINNTTGEITYVSPETNEFVVTATAPNGTSVSVAVTVSR